jgi:anti-anti-sigma factor
VLVIVVTGELDLAIADRFEAELDVELGRLPVVVDVSGVGFMDSSAVRILVQSQRKLAAAGHRSAIVVTPGSVVERTLALMTVDDSVKIFPTRPEAVEALVP